MPETKEPQMGTYQHYKGGFYEVLGIADEAETGRRLVVYRALGMLENLLPPNPKEHFDPKPGVTPAANRGALAACSVERFTELVDGKAYHPGEKVPRFRLVAADPSH